MNMKTDKSKYFKQSILIIHGAISYAFTCFNTTP